MDIKLLKELSNKTLGSYRRKAKSDRSRWIGRAIAKAKMTGEIDPSATSETNVRIGSTERNRAREKQVRKALQRTLARYRSRPRD